MFEFQHNTEKQYSKMKKFWAIFALFLVLLIPIGFLYSIISDRIEYKTQAEGTVTKSWGSQQNIHPPYLSYKDEKGKETHFDLNNYDVNVSINTEIRKKGIFHIPVYTANVDITGDFEPIPNNFLRKKLNFSFNVSDSAGFTDEPYLNLNNIDYKLKSTDIDIFPDSNVIKFKISYNLRGINKISVIPKGTKNNIKISGNWSNPSFEGDFLPAERTVNNSDFSANWSIPKISISSITVPSVGVSLLVPVDNYRMSERALKYASLFLGLTFLSYFIFEIQSKNSRKIHPLQYLLLGTSMLIFYLLLVSLSEFMSFKTAYICAASMIVLLISSYTYFVISKRQNIMLTVIIYFLLTILYVFLYILLSLQDYSLLIGSLGLFIIIAIIMFATRNIDWYSEGE